MSVELPSIAIDEPSHVTVNVSSELSFEARRSIQKISVQTSLESLEQIDWNVDLLARRHLTSKFPTLFIRNETKATDTFGGIINRIGENLVSNGVLSIDNWQQVFSSLVLLDNFPSRWIEVDNFLILGTSHPSLSACHHVFYRLEEPSDLGFKDPIRFIALIIGPTRMKPTKSVTAVTHSYASAFSDHQLQHDLIQCANGEEAKAAIVAFLDRATSGESPPLPKAGHVIPSRVGPILFGSLFHDVKSRFPLYWSDWRDGVDSARAIARTTAATFFLYFACLLPAIAFGAHNQYNTNGKITVAKTILAQGAGGVIFSLLAGQPMVVLLNTAPLAIYIQLTYEIATRNNFDFWGFYALIGLFNGCFLVLYGITSASSLMKHSSRFVEEIFALFITIAFIVDGTKPIAEELRDKIYTCDGGSTSANGCDAFYPLLLVILAFVTLWICFKLSNFRNTVYFRLGVREAISDYALPLGVLLASGFRHAVFFPLHIPEFSADKGHLLSPADFSSIPLWGYFVALGLGFLLSLLFFVDQNISAALANALPHKLKKWGGYHIDLFVVGLINIALSLLGLPWIHGALPHSALHVRALATLQKVYHQGHVEEKFVQVQETRASGFLSHVLLAVSVLLLPNPLRFIPLPVLYGVFWYLGVKALVGNQFWNRILLLITDRRSYPPSVADRQVSQKEMHLFTTVQIICLLVFCFVSFYPNPYLTAAFPVVIVLLIPLRRFVMPKFLSRRAIAILDAYFG
eukprot:TRINITY_DN7798_c0_g1_i1.p1 TRINITY_DN7798_c0_g1~~TRINITY_DN7798_c0_g1_i1.p1  ORF type:complete len:745 (-),score=92.45 TRINITY_DN7798_c0_g1_i1:950-3184(-)